MRERFFAPSEFHLNLMEKTPREFAWRGGDFHSWQAALRERLRQCLGTLPDDAGPLEAEEIEKEETSEYVQIRLVFTAEQCADVPAYLLVPKGRPGPLPAMVCLQGHGSGAHVSVGRARDDADRGLVADDLDFALQAVRHGFVALALEQRCFAERAENRQKVRSESTCLDAVCHSLMLGRTLAGERVWDVMRGIDLLQEQPEVDSGRIACIGHSGGGTVLFYAASLDERIKLSVISCAFCTYADAIMRIQHCADNYVPGILRLAEMGELAGLIAPRKMIAVAGETDDIFPLAGVRKAFGAAQEVFAAAGCPGHVQLVVGSGGHRFYADLAWPLIGRMMG